MTQALPRPTDTTTQYPSIPPRKFDLWQQVLASHPQGQFRGVVIGYEYLSDELAQQQFDYNYGGWSYTVQRKPDDPLWHWETAVTLDETELCPINPDTTPFPSCWDKSQYQPGHHIRWFCPAGTLMAESSGGTGIIISVKRCLDEPPSWWIYEIKPITGDAPQTTFTVDESEIVEVLPPLSTKEVSRLFGWH